MCHSSPGRDTANAAAKPTASQRLRADEVPWDSVVEAAVLQFWTDQGALLPEAEVQPEQQVEQRRMRSKILRWAAKHPRHRSLEALADYMARLRDAAATSDWADEPWRIALQKQELIWHNSSPASLLHKLQAVQHALAEHGVCLSHTKSLMLIKHGGNAIATRAVPLLLALDALPISLDFTDVVSKAPTLLSLHDVGAVLQRRVVAMQQLDPQLDIARVFSKQPNLLTWAEETVASHWVSLQMATGLSNDDMRALVEARPAVLAQNPGVIAWKMQQYRAYQIAKTGSASCTSLSSMSLVLSSAPHKVWRLRYLVVAAGFRYAALVWINMPQERFAALNPGHSLWFASHPVPPEAYRDWYS